MTALLPDSNWVLARLGIDLKTIRTIQPCWQRSTYQAIVNWLMRYQYKAGKPNIEKLRGYIEAIELLCSLQRWDAAHGLLQVPLTSDRTVTEQLQVWGYAQARVALHSPLLDRLPPLENSFHLDCLATAHLALRADGKARQYARAST